MELLLGSSFYRFNSVNIYLDIVHYSNHGGRQIDTAVSAIQCLEQIINLVNGRAEGIFRSIIIYNIFLTIKTISQKIL
jgi:hypothetical protein